MEMLNQYGLWGLFAGTFLGSSFLPAAGLPVLIFSIYAKSDLMHVFVIASLGNWLGAVLSFYLGKIWSWEWIEKYFRIKQRHLFKASSWVKRYEVYAGIGTGIPVIGDRISLAMGLFKTKSKPTLFWMFIGKCLRYSILIPLIVYSL